MTNLQEQVQLRVDELAETEIGLQVAAYQSGELVVDAVVGVADPEARRPVTADTLFFSASTGKGASATVANVLVDRGVLAYDAPIADVWPEFAAHGKKKATLRHVLTHSIGLPALPSDATSADLADWTKITSYLAAAEPWWEPGTKTAYHSETFGYLVGEIVRRTTGRTISDVLREIAAPLGIADEVYFAVPRDQRHRVAKLVEPAGAEDTFAQLAHMFAEVEPPAVMPRAAHVNTPEYLAAELPARGILTARGIAKLYAALIGKVDGVRLVRPGAIAEITGPALVAKDELLGNPATWALGYPVGRLGSTAEESPTSFGMPGMGGSVAWADTRSGVAFALTRTLFDPAQSASAIEIGNLVAQSLC
ncbi:class A beta-lactamase-related serine hydrolase [Kribbella pittospori]|uniref:Class A beta-lactamase-related serine hydrolase n=1 Tax=Kribbella pittospori TaxID=722689 RepID=A0A4R0KHW5_9ACTN|nr:serine hydrolase domain-containing protein [Kribbella pittospori]TCC58226.1 class A beta-lactamase-related serine hydrolase [Kribbella pittospori]